MKTRQTIEFEHEWASGPSDPSGIGMLAAAWAVAGGMLLLMLFG